MISKNKSVSAYRTRFAPSPTGPLHFGSLVTALGSYLRAHSKGGLWLIRIEDIDPPRQVKGAIEHQLQTLAGFGLKSQLPVIYQSDRIRAHRQAIAALVDQRLAYPCGCSSKELPKDAPYPGTCRHGLPTGRAERSIRLKTHNEVVFFNDALQGPQQQNPSQQTGDFIIRRGDGLMAYQLVVVVDDHAQKITEVVRGADLMDSVGRQCLLYDALKRPRPEYLHLPVVVDENGRKLSKSDGADPIEALNQNQVFRLALRALGHEPPNHAMSLEAQWQWAIKNWTLERVPQGPVSI
ncbi:MAG TPA: tRNA glutamyl-Q(34) synthetase GluQRS [Wenzhouxiangella sp.]